MVRPLNQERIEDQSYRYAVGRRGSRIRRERHLRGVVVIGQFGWRVKLCPIGQAGFGLGGTPDGRSREGREKMLALERRLAPDRMKGNAVAW
jgi:hypothetical protein